MNTPPPFYNKLEEKQVTKGHMPHWSQRQKLYAVTFRLNDSLPEWVIKAYINITSKQSFIMKKYLFYAATALAVVGCSNDDYLGNNDGNNGQNGNTAIQFGGAAGKITRADATTSRTYATKSLRSNGFWVYGTKHTDGAEDAQGTNDQVVYKNYLVKYVGKITDNAEEDEQNKNTNQSTTNTAGWEYVGVDNKDYKNNVTPNVLQDNEKNAQTIKYWDYSAAHGYTFYAATAKPDDVKNGNITITKKTEDDRPPQSKYGKGYTVNIKDDADLSQLYFADRKEVAKDNYKNEVKLTFRNALAKVRVGMYETIPGYDVKIDNFYYTAEGETSQTKENTKNFVADATSTKLETSTDGVVYTVVYYDDNNTDLTNQPHMLANESGEGSQKTYLELGGKFFSNGSDAVKLGTESNTPTYDSENGAYTFVMPQTDNKDPLKLKVDYTLISLDGTNEEIHVKGATAIIPADYLQWKPNYAYTYIFKISDKTNGGTGSGDDPTGLYPITFDAAVVTTGDGIQETITTASVPSITTYGKDAVNNEYKSGTNIYVSVAKNDGNYIELTDDNAKLYKVTQHEGYDVTEANVANCFEHGLQTKDGDNSEFDTWTVQETVNRETKEMKITTVSVPSMSIVQTIPADDVVGGNAISGKFAKFTPNVDKETYFVFEYRVTTQNEDGDEVTQRYFKVIKVVPNN